MKTYDFSDRKLKLLIVLAIVIIGWLCFRGATAAHAQSAPATTSPNVQEVVKLSKAHLSDDVILAYIKNSGVSYTLGADDVLYLNAQGVSQPVISALLQAQPPAAQAPVPPPAQPLSPPTAAVQQPSTPAPTVSE